MVSHSTRCSKAVCAVLATFSMTLGLALSVRAAAPAGAPPTPKKSMAEAKAIAAKKMHGKATKASYEFEDGRWQYAVIVVSGKQMWEVEVDPNTGKVLDTEKTSAKEEAAEAAADQKKAAGQKEPAEKGETEKGEKGEKD